MKPLIIHACTAGISATRLLGPQCRYLAQNGWRVGLIFSPGPEAEELRREGFTVETIAMARDIRPLEDLRAGLRLWRYFRRVRPAIVHTHTSKAGIIGRLAARLAGVPLVVHTVHGFPFIEGMPGSKYRFFVFLEKMAGRWADVLLSQSAEDLATAEKEGILSRTGQRPIYLGNGVDLNAFDPANFPVEEQLEVRRSLGIPAGVPTIAMVGRINREKGHEELVQALAGVPGDWRLLVIGPDEGFKPDLVRRIDQLGIGGRVVFAGYRTDIAALLSASDIFVLPSYREGVPRSVIEAQAMALPAVVTDIRGCREVVSGGETGLIVPPRTVEPLAEALRRLLTDPELRRRMGKAGRDRMLSKFDERQVFETIQEIYLQYFPRERRLDN